MPKAIKHDINFRLHMNAEEVFTDREEPRKAFWDIYNNMESGDYEIIVYYGVGGIGKTTLLKKIQREIDEKIPQSKKLDHAFFSFEGHASKEDFLFNLSRQMMLGNNGLTFPLFETALIRIANEEGKDLSKFEESAKRSFIENPLVDAALSISGEFVVGLGAVTQLVDHIVSFANRKITEKERTNGVYSHLYNEIKYGSSVEIRKNLHKYFNLDVFDYFSNRKRPYVIFLDGYENLVSIVREGALAEYEDEWISNPNDGLINIPNTLWVIAGREKIYWNQEILPLEHLHRVGDLSEIDATDYFKKAGIVERDLIKALYGLSGGTPVYMDLCVKRYWEVKKLRTPIIDDFGKDTAELAKRYLGGMPEAAREIMVMLSFFPKVWDEEMVKSVAKRLNCEIYLSRLDDLLKLSLFEQTALGYKLHETFKNVTQKIYHDRKNKYYQAVAEYLKEWLLCSDSSMYRSEKLRQFCEQINLCEQIQFSDGEIKQIVNVIREENEMSGNYQMCGYLIGNILEFVFRYRVSKEIIVCCENVKNYNLKQLGKYEEMLSLSKKTYECAEMYLGSEHIETLKAQRNLAMAHTALGNYGKAKEINEQCYERGKKVLGELDKYTLAALNNLAGSFYYIGEYEQAKELMQYCYEIKKKALGEQHIETLKTLQNLASIYEELGQYIKAKEFAEKCCKLKKQILGEEHPSVIRALLGIASLYSRLGEYSIAKDIKEQCYDIQKRVLGEEHPETLDMLSSLDSAYILLGEYERAKELNENCYNSRKKILGEEHPDTLASLYKMAIIYEDMGELQIAKEIMQKSYDLRKKILGEEHPETLLSLSCLLTICMNLGEYEQLKFMAQQCYDVQKRILGEEHPDTLDTLNNLAIAYDMFKEYETAKMLKEKCYNGYKRVLGEEHPSTLHALSNLANSYETLEDYQMAKELMKKCYEASKTRLGETHPDTIEYKENLGILEGYFEKES